MFCLQLQQYDQCKNQVIPIQVGDLLRKTEEILGLILKKCNTLLALQPGLFQAPNGGICFDRSRLTNHDYFEATKSQLSAALDSMNDKILSKEKVDLLYKELTGNIRDHDNIFGTINNILSIADQDVSKHIVSKLSALWLNNPMSMSSTTNIQTIVWDDVLGKINNQANVVSLMNEYGLTLLYQICQMYIPNTDWFDINNDKIRMSLGLSVNNALKSLVDICRISCMLETLEKSGTERWTGRCDLNMVMCLLKGCTNFHALIEELSDALSSLNALLICKNTSQNILYALNNSTTASVCHAIGILILKSQQLFKSMIVPALSWLQEQIELCMCVFLMHH